MQDVVVRLVRQTDARLAAQGIDLGLGALADVLETEEVDPGVLDAAIAQLGSRADTLRAAADDVEGVHGSLAHIAKVLKFTSDWWPTRRRQLTELIADDAVRGLGAFLNDWFEAMSQGRVGAAERLASMPLPPGGEVLAERLRVATAALREGNWEAGHSTLRLGAAGVAMNGETVPGSAVRRDLRLVLARLAMLRAEFEEADRELDAVEDQAAPGVIALRCRWRRLQSLPDAFQHVETLGGDASVDIDVAAEVIAKARTDGQHESAVSAARVAIEAVPALFDAEEDLSTPARQTPPEIWLAVAERALREEHAGLLDRALERADAGTDWEDYPLRLALAQVRVDSSELSELPAHEIVTHRISAGSYAMATGSLVTAREHFEAALVLEPDNAEVAARLADCLISTVWNQPLAHARDDIERARELIAGVVDRPEVFPELSWGYVTEAAVHRQLARGLGPATREHFWPAFLAVCRSLAYDPTDANRWSELSVSAQDLGLSLVSIVAAERAVLLSGSQSDAMDGLTQAEVNAGNLERALELVGGGTGAWHRGLRGYIALRRGEPAAAVVELSGPTIDPAWVWAAETLLVALLIAGRDDEALLEATAIVERYRSRVDERAFASTTAAAALVMGNTDSAHEIVSRLQEADEGSDFLWTLAGTRLVRGDEAGALAALHERTARATSIRELDEWSSIVKPTLEAVSRRSGKPLLPTEALDREVVERRAEVMSLSGPIDELRHRKERERDLPGTNTAGPLAEALMHLGQGEQEEALRVVTATLETDPDDTAVAELHRHLLSLVVVEPSAGVVPEPAGADVGVPESDAAYFQTVLPASWFEGHAEPLLTHPLFTQYLPEMRVSAPVDVAPVRVKAHEDLEPDGYRILLGGKIRREGRVDTGYRYLGSNTVALLPGELRGMVDWNDGADAFRIPVAAIAGIGGLATLLSRAAAEIVVREIADVAVEAALAEHAVGAQGP